jgi:CubicO group peptidase (beta-lactamase class C family)
MSMRIEIVFGLGLVLLTPAAFQARLAAQEPRQIVFPGATWEQRSPEELGMDAAKLEEFAERVGGFGVVIKDGYLAYRWGEHASSQDWFSAAKPVLSTLLFFAVQEGRLQSVDDRVGEWIDLSEKDQPMTFRHLADMTSGYMRPERPGEAYSYNDYGIMLYIVALERIFGQTLEEALAQRMGALDFQHRVFSEPEVRGGGRIITPPLEFARIGWFWLNRGRWRGEPLLEERFFDEYLQPDVPADLPRSSGEDTENYLGLQTYGGRSNQTHLGPGTYGFNWWFNERIDSEGTRVWPDAPPDTYQANGRWGRDVMTMFPSLNMVVVGEGTWGSEDPGQRYAEMNQSLRLLVEAAGGIRSGPAVGCCPDP